MITASGGNVRSARPEGLVALADLLNETWKTLRYQVIESGFINLVLQLSAKLGYCYHNPLLQIISIK